MTYQIQDSHLPRKLFHVAGVSLIPTIYYFEPIPRQWQIATLAVITVAWVAFDFARLKNRKINDLFHHWFSGLMKKKEGEALTGVSYMLVGATLSLVLFPAPLNVTVLYFAALGDPAAAVVGKMYGKIKLFRERTLEGSMAMFLVCVGIGSLLLDFGALVVVGALAATAAELYADTLDDNLLVPLVSGVVMTMLVMG